MLVGEARLVALALGLGHALLALRRSAIAGESTPLVLALGLQPSAPLVGVGAGLGGLAGDEAGVAGAPLLVQFILVLCDGFGIEAGDETLVKRPSGPVLTAGPSGRGAPPFSGMAYICTFWPATARRRL